MRPRPVWMALVAVSVLAACAAPGELAESPPATPPAVSGPEDADRPAPQAPAPPAERPPAEPAPTQAPGQPTPGRHEPPPPAPSDHGTVGDNATVYLRGTVPRLVIEVVAVEGGRPSPAALEHLRSVLSTVVSKPDGVEVLPVRPIPVSQDQYTVQDMRRIERNYRQTSSTAQQASMFVMYLDGEFVPERSTLGVAYSASAFAIFARQIDRAVTALVSRVPIERAVLVHETGHLLRLVNIGYRSPREREDSNYRHHSANRRSVMYWAVQDLSVTSVLTGGPPDDFDADDRADLADLKAGRL